MWSIPGNMLQWVLFFDLIVFSFCSCSKNLKLDEGHSKQYHNDIIELTPREQVLMNLRTDSVRMDSIYESTTLLGKAIVDENKLRLISSRVNGRVDKLFVRNPGEEIKEGQLLYSIYSEELLSYENEYLLFLKKYSEFHPDFNIVKKMILASKEKLLLLGMSEKQIEELKVSKVASPLVNFFSMVNGYLAELNINEGEYVLPGTALFKIAQSTTVWIEAQIFPYEIIYLGYNPLILINIDALPGKKFIGELVLIPAAFENNVQINFIKVEVENNGGMIKPGMMATVILKTGGKNSLVVPKSSVIPGEMPFVWIEAESGMFEMRMVHTGIETKSEVEILDGLKLGDKIVISGVYLLNSAQFLKTGTIDMSGMNM